VVLLSDEWLPDVDLVCFSFGIFVTTLSLDTPFTSQVVGGPDGRQEKCFHCTAGRRAYKALASRSGLSIPRMSVH
jgi:hypothetical protein